MAWAAVFAVALTCGRVAWECRAEEALGKAALARGDRWEAAIHFERAVHWYLPGDPAWARSADALWQVADRAERAGDAETAVDAFRMLRSGLLSVRSLYQPRPDLLARSEERIAALMERDPEGAWPERSLPAAEREARLLANLRHRDDPRTGWVVVLEAGFLAWVGGAVGFALRAYRGPTGWDGRAAARWGALVVVGYALWVVGMARA